VAAGLALFGCASAPSEVELHNQRLAEGQLRTRIENMGAPLAALAAHEAAAPARRDGTLRVFEAFIHDDVEQTRENGVRIQQALDFESQRWNERQRRYADEARSILGGRPQNVPQTLLLFL